MLKVTDRVRRALPGSPLALALTLLAAQPAGAQSSAGKAGAGNADDQLQEVVGVGRYEFPSADTSAPTNLPRPIEKVPQSISLVTQDFIKAADLKSLGEIAQYTPGALN